MRTPFSVTNGLIADDVPTHFVDGSTGLVHVEHSREASDGAGAMPWWRGARLSADTQSSLSSLATMGIACTGPGAANVIAR